jgi:DNA topoisomerase-1
MKTGACCPSCKGDLVERKTRQKKRVFYGCNNYPICNFAVWERPVPDPCPKCGSLMVIPKGGQDPVCYEEVLASQRSMEDKPQQDGEGQSKRGVRRKKASEEAISETSSGSAGETSNKEIRSPRKKKVSGVAISEISSNGAKMKKSKNASGKIKNEKSEVTNSENSPRTTGVKRSMGKKKSTEESVLEDNLQELNSIRRKKTSSTGRKKISGETIAEPNSNGARATGSKTTHKKAAIVMLAEAGDENTQDEAVQDTTTHETANGHVSARTAKAMAKKR